MRVNQSLSELTGYSERELLARTRHHPHDFDKNAGDIADLIMGRIRFMRTEKR